MHFSRKYAFSPKVLQIVNYDRFGKYHDCLKETRFNSIIHLVIRVLTKNWNLLVTKSCE